MVAAVLRYNGSTVPNGTQDRLCIFGMDYRRFTNKPCSDSGGDTLKGAFENTCSVDS